MPDADNEMSTGSTVRDVLEEYDANRLASGEVPWRLMDALVEADPNAALAELTADQRERVLWELRDSYGPILGHEPWKYIIIEAVSIRAGHERSYQLDRACRTRRLRRVKLPFIQAWLRTLPLPACMAFPLDDVASLLARVDREIQSAPAMSTVAFRTWRRSEEGRRHRSLCAVSVDLATCLERGRLAGEGSQEQAMAWHGLARVTAVLRAAYVDLEPAHQSCLDRADAILRDYRSRDGTPL